MYIKCLSCGKEFQAVPFSKARCHRKYKCTCGAIHDLPITLVTLHVAEESLWKDIEAWLTEQNITEWLYQRTYDEECIRAKGVEPSMEDILASIRRILSDEEFRTVVFFNKDDAILYKMVWS